MCKENLSLAPSHQSRNTHCQSASGGAGGGRYALQLYAIDSICTSLLSNLKPE